MIRAFIFDLDGTLVDTEILWVRAFETYLHDKGLPISHAESLDILYGKSWHDVYAEARKRFPALTPGIGEMEAELQAYFDRERAKGDVRIHGSITLLKRLAATHPVCIVSGSPRENLTAEIEKIGVGPHLAFFLASGDYSPGKPDPACFLLAAERLGVPPEDCVVFEDSAAGIRAAKRAGMRAVALARPSGPDQDFSEADLVLDSLDKFSPEAFNAA